MHHVRQENLPFVGSSHKFVGAEQGDPGVSVFLFHGKPGPGGKPVRDWVRTCTLTGGASPSPTITSTTCSSRGIGRGSGRKQVPPLRCISQWSLS